MKHRYVFLSYIVLFLGLVPVFPNDSWGKMRSNLTQKRSEMVETQLRTRGINDERVLASMNSVPRHLFVASSLKAQAYDDSPLSIGYEQTISQPYIVALMAQEARLGPEDTLLEVGTGCGYAAAVFSKLVKKVYSIEYVPELTQEAKKRLHKLGYANVTVLQGDGSIGLEECAPFDAILVAATAPTVPPPLKEQLAIKGRLIIPVQKGPSQMLIRITRLDENLYQEEVLQSVRFVPLKGEEGWDIN